MITKNCALAVSSGLIWGNFVHVSLMSRSRPPRPVECRANGRVKLWKRDPSRWKLPVKYGLRECFYLSNDGYGNEDPARWVHPTWDAAKAELTRAMDEPLFERLAGAEWEENDPHRFAVLADRAEELGLTLLARILRAGLIPN